MENPNINNDWQNILESEFSKEYYLKLQEFLDKQYADPTIEISPARGLIFEALKLTPFEKVKVVIVGQDTTPVRRQAFGVAFSVPLGTWIPTSVSKIYEELQNDLGLAPVSHGCLDKWTKQGVLLLNAILTVRQGRRQDGNGALSHEGKGWETFTDAIVERLNDRKKPVVFILWGDIAKKKLKLITNGFQYEEETFNTDCMSLDEKKRHLILTANHPAASGYEGTISDFPGSKPFSKANTFLEIKGKLHEGLQPIDWKLPSYMNSPATSRH